MKFGPRIPSLRKRIAARTSPARFIRHSLGLKAPRGWGWVTNPRKALYNRVYNRTTFSVLPSGCLMPILLALFLLALLASLTHAQTAYVYGPSGAYMGRVTMATPSLSPGAIPRATVEGMTVGAQECPKERASDSIRKYLPAGVEPAPGYGVCDGRRMADD